MIQKDKIHTYISRYLVVAATKHAIEVTTWEGTAKDAVYTFNDLDANAVMDAVKYTVESNQVHCRVQSRDHQQIQHQVHSQVQHRVHRQV